MFQVMLSLLLAFEKLLISAFEKQAQECCIMAGDFCGKHNTSYTRPYVYTATATARVTNTRALHVH